MSTAQLARIQLLVKAARLEMVGLRSTDYRLRWATICDLNDLLKELRAPIEIIGNTHGLPTDPSHPSAIDERRFAE
jgi:hypothetical protein